MRRRLRARLPALTHLFGLSPRQFETDVSLAEIPYYLAYLDDYTAEAGEGG